MQNPANKRSNFVKVEYTKTLISLDLVTAQHVTISEKKVMFFQFGEKYLFGAENTLHQKNRSRAFQKYIFHAATRKQSRLMNEIQKFLRIMRFCSVSSNSVNNPKCVQCKLDIAGTPIEIQYL